MSGGAKLMAVLKADAYGQGMERVAMSISDMVDYFAVAYVEEGVSLRKIDRLTPILILVFDKESIRDALRYNLTLSISSLEELSIVVNYVRSHGEIVDIHLAINSGMNRYGFDDVNAFRCAIDVLNNVKCVRMTGVYSHLYDNDTIHNEMQCSVFDEYIKIARERYQGSFLTHILASGGIINNVCHYDMVRMGISLYVGNEDGIEDAFALKSEVQSIRRVNKGQFVGYSCHYTAKCDIMVAVIYGGYADGIDKRLTGSFVRIGDAVAEIIGDICMDVFFVDVTDMDVHVGDEVTIIGDDITIEAVAKHANVSTYELITNIQGRCIRSYI